MSVRKVVVIGVASGYGASDPACQDGPEALRLLGFLSERANAVASLRWNGMIRLPLQPPGSDPVDAVAAVVARLSERVRHTLVSGHFPLVIGGDHSCAIGTWSGVLASLNRDDHGARLGLIWLDAHMDSHTPDTSPSGAIHGMPLACLLGYGDPRLTRIVTAAGTLHPQDVCLIGVRSFEPAEAQLLQDLGVKIFFMEEVRARGFATVFRAAQAWVTRATAGFGISLDLDVFEPSAVPGVSTPAAGGLLPAESGAICRALAGDSRLRAMEIVEYNPYRDSQFATARVVQTWCEALLQT